MLKVVIDDIEYEIICTIDYVKFLKEEISRCEEIKKYSEKIKTLTKQSDIESCQKYVNMLLKQGESIENIDELRNEFEKAYSLRNGMLNGLRQEIKNIKKLKV